MGDFIRGALSEAAARSAELGPAGWAAFVALYAAACAAGLPASVLTLAAGAVYGVRLGFLLVWTGAVAGLSLSFLLARRWLRGWVEPRLERRPAFAAIAEAAAAEGWRVVLLTRLTPLLPFALLNYAYGLTRVPFAEYACASAVGIVPGTLLFVSLGAAGASAVQGRARAPAEKILLLVGIGAGAGAVWLIGRSAKAALARRTRPGA